MKDPAGLLQLGRYCIIYRRIDQPYIELHQHNPYQIPANTNPTTIGANEEAIESVNEKIVPIIPDK